MLEFTWPTFVFAVVNFLILVLLLYRLLHKPLLDVLEKRRKAIEQARKEAEDAVQKAQAVRAEYEGKLASMHDERDKMLSEARNRIQEVRDKVLSETADRANKEVAKLRDDWEHQRRDAMESLEKEITEVSLDLARSILQKLTDDDLDERLMALLHRELGALASPERRDRHRDLFASGAAVRVASARPLESAARRQVQERIEALSEGPVEVRFEADPDLIAGARVEFSSMALDASLADVLDATRERLAEMAPEQPREARDR